MKILAHSSQNVELYRCYIVVNRVSELLQTAAVSSPVILPSMHVHMCIYDRHTGLRHIEQLIMHVIGDT